ncbi:hypothetical protein SNE40_017460 [Patella caerulea]|uniref:Alpha-type protein kinase domain-containing protein n=1 Tax=Patella caerulea TaxID=87958 RepID=A0AAN8JB65_PATCE
MELFSNATYHTDPDCNNNTYHVDFDFLQWQRGYTTKAFKGILKGSGERRGSKILVKAFRNKPGSSTRCENELQKHRKAQELMQAFNEKFPEALNMSLTWVTKSTIENAAFFHKGRRLKENEHVIVEEIITDKFKYFVDPHFRRLGKTPKDLQTLMHFSYDFTGGQMVLSGLKGARTSDGFRFTFPTIHSMNGGFGEKDEGERGIEKCFENHVCNAVCARWLRPDSDTVVEQRPRAPSAPYDPEMLDGFPGYPPPYTPSPEVFPDTKLNFSDGRIPYNVYLEQTFQGGQWPFPPICNNNGEEKTMFSPVCCGQNNYFRLDSLHKNRNDEVFMDS